MIFFLGLMSVAWTALWLTAIYQVISDARREW